MDIGNIFWTQPPALGYLLGLRLDIYFKSKYLPIVAPIIVDLSGNLMNFADRLSLLDKNSTSRWQVVVFPLRSHPSNTIRAPRLPQPDDIFLKSSFKILVEFVKKREWTNSDGVTKRQFYRRRKLVCSTRTTEKFVLKFRSCLRFMWPKSLI